ncbi:hypothetical protein DM02DRAFT_414627 [Periconia macrospinosa]|uniref:Uncharacterized protein n=1 Tax=Periconia macrospinosa TaxID=97972 RepID=A0A2V1DNW3_9PLEO|nr:hypothetical protein DM02DRAFT_414627 [Periconia macrospinosa]
MVRSGCIITTRHKDGARLHTTAPAVTATVTWLQQSRCCLIFISVACTSQHHTGRAEGRVDAQPCRLRCMAATATAAAPERTWGSGPGNSNGSIPFALPLDSLSLAFASSSSSSPLAINTALPWAMALPHAISSLVCVVSRKGEGGPASSAVPAL